MVRNGEVVAALTNWQAVIVLVAVLLPHAAWRSMRRRLRQPRTPKTPTHARADKNDGRSSRSRLRVTYHDAHARFGTHDSQLTTA
jgi:hypothetical protein